jgi:hypothetical protein
MAYRGFEVDDEYADDQHFIKIYVDFDTADECYRFADIACGERFGAMLDEFAREAEREEKE